MFLPIRVLILEDQEDDCILLLRELRRGGFEPDYLRIETESAMLSALKIEHWDIILSDYTMPEFSAPAALKVLKRSKKDVPFIVVSGNVGEITAVQLMQHGASDYINKDNLSRLCPAIQRELNEARERKLRYESEAITNRLWDIFNSSMNEIYVFDSKTFQFITVNEAALKNLGYNLSEMKIKFPWDIKPDISEEEFKNKVSPIQTNRIKSLYFETTHVRKNGTTYPVEIRLQITDEENPIFYAIIIDITERKKSIEKIESLARFPEENPQPVLRINHVNQLIYNNPSSNEMIAEWSKTSEKRTPNSWNEIIELCRRTKTHQFFEDKINNKTYSWLLYPSNEGDYINCYGHDITTQKENEKDLNRYFEVFKNITEGIMICDKQDIITAINPAFTKITGLSEDDALGKSATLLNTDKNENILCSTGKEIVQSQGKWQGEYLFKNINGKYIPVNLSISTIRNKNIINNYVYVFSDIEERKQTLKHIHNLSYYDTLTKLPNRLHVQERIFDLIEEAEDASESISIIYLDINRFKTINESLGHQTADIALSLISKRLQNAVPENSFLGRMGADEFIIVINNSIIETEDSDIIKNISNIFLDSFELQGQETYINATLGVSHFPSDGKSADELIKHAETAVAYAKRQEKQIEIYSTNFYTRNKTHIRLETDLRKALERNEYVLYYQPKIDLNTGEIVGVEALIRWEKPVVGLVPPGEFIPLLEETGLIIPVGNWVIEESCRQLNIWEAEGISKINIAVNLSGKQFNQKNLVNNILKILNTANVSPEVIELEVTESTIMRQYENVISTLNELHNHKFLISIDDFGTGHSSLAYLKHFPIDILKVDRSFVMEIPQNKDDVAIVNTIISMGHNLNLKVIAEGVETIEQMEILQEMGCELAQGFYFSRPLPASEVTRILKDKSQFRAKRI